jgi:hypothetical protein
MGSENKGSTRRRIKRNSTSTSTSTSTPCSGNGNSNRWKYKKEIRQQVNQNKRKDENHGVLKGFKYDYHSGGETTQIEDYVEVTKKIVYDAGSNYICMLCEIQL